MSELVEMVEQLKKIEYDRSIEKKLLIEVCLYLYKELPLIDKYITSKQRFKKYKHIYYGDVKIYEDGSITTYNVSGDYIWIIIENLKRTIAQLEDIDKKVIKLSKIVELIRD